MSRIGKTIRVETENGLIGPTLVGKRVNFCGDLGTVSEQSDRLCVIKFDRWNSPSVAFQSVIAALPILHSRKEFYPYV